MYTKAGIFNLALGMLLLQRQISDTENDKSNEAKILNAHWLPAFYKTLEDLDLDSTSTTMTLSLVEADPNDQWDYAYEYPANCAMLRRVVDPNVDQIIDDRYSAIVKRVGIHEGEKVIFTDMEAAKAEIIDKDIDLSVLNASAGLALAAQLANLSATLIVGKGAKSLKESIMEQYKIYKAEAQETDRIENANFVDPRIESEFVRERMS